MKKTVCRLGLMVLLAMLANGALARTEGEKAVAGIGERLRANDCPGAVEALNAGLQGRHPEVALLAGTMFEAGFCVKKSWDKAMGFYTQAHDGGIREGALRLAAGFAADANGPDTAAALWWAKRAKLEAGYCTEALPETDDPDRFMAVLREWQVHDREVCNYVVGKMSFIIADARYPMAGISKEVSGSCEVVFTRGANHFKSKPSAFNRTSAYRISEVLQQSVSHAGVRYRQPGGIEPSWQIVFVIPFDTDKSRWW